MPTQVTRRTAIRRAAVAGTALVATATLNPLAHAAERKRKFTIDLVGGAIGVNASPVELIQLAAKHLSLIHI